MAEISDQTLERMVEAIEELMRRGVPVGDNLRKVVDDYRKGLTGAIKNLTDANKTIDAYSKSLKKGRTDISGVSSVLEDLNESLSKMDNTVSEHQKTQIRGRMEQLRQDAEQANRQQALSKAFKETASSLTGTTVTAVTDFGKNLFSTSSGFKIAGDLFSTGLEVANTALQGTAGAVSAIGSGMAMLGKSPWTKGVGIALDAGAKGAAALGDASKKAAQAGLGIVVQEAEKLVKAWHEATAAGAIMAGGATEFRTAALKAGMAPDELASMLKSQSQLFAQSGATVAETVRRVGEVGSVLAKTGMRRELITFGIGVQEQAEIMADVMARQRKFGVVFDATKVAGSVAELGKQMRIVADLTGEDAKKRMAETRKQTDRYATRAKIAEIAKSSGKNAADLAKNIEVGLSKYDSMTQKVYTDILTTGTTTETAAYLIPGFIESIQQSVEATRKTGEFQQDSMAQFASANKDVYNEGLVAMDVAGRLTGAFEDYNTKINAAALSFQTINEQTIKTAEQSARSLEKTLDPLTKIIANVEEQTISLKVAMQNELTPYIEQFGKVAVEIIDMIKTALGQSGIGGRREGNSVMRNVLDYGGTALGGLVGGLGGLFFGGAGSVPGAIGGAMVGQSVGVSIADAFNLPKAGDALPLKADGGVVNKPVIAGEAGPEAIVPLPNGRSIPVDLDLRPLVAAINDLVDINKDNRDYLEKLFHASV